MFARLLIWLCFLCLIAVLVFPGQPGAGDDERIIQEIPAKIVVQTVPHVFYENVTTNSRTQVTRLIEVTAIRFDYGQATHQCKFASRLISETRTNQVRSSTWHEVESLPPLPTPYPHGVPTNFIPPQWNRPERR